jgi:predicted metal-dependent hydrolase
MKYWCDNSPIWTHYGNASSILFPAWERAFASVIKHYLPLVHDAELKLRMVDFMKEELAHASAHEAFNKRNQLQDLQEAEFKRTRAIHRKPKMQFWLGIMVSIEHLASCMSRSVLNRWGHREGRDYKLFCWHSKEELGHKSLAIDLWRYLGHTDADLRKIAIINQRYVMKFLIGYTLRKTITEGQFKHIGTWKDALVWSAFVTTNVLIPMLKIYLPNFHPSHINDDMYLQGVA